MHDSTWQQLRGYASVTQYASKPMTVVFLLIRIGADLCGLGGFLLFLAWELGLVHVTF